MDILKNDIFDVIIIGGGPAGMTASVYLARKNIRHMLISPDMGGQVNWTVSVENYMGYKLIEGPLLMEKFEKHVEEFKIEIIRGMAVDEIGIDADIFYVKSGVKKYHSKTLLIASGKNPRKLDIPGEKELTGRGVAYCATCDAPLFRNLPVAVVGGGNSALTSAIDLSNYATRIYVFNNTGSLTADPVLIEKAAASGKAEFFNNVKVTEIQGAGRVEGIAVNVAGEKRLFSVKGVFIEVGLIPNTGFVNGLIPLNDDREVIVDSFNRTKTPGVFAAGDVTDVPEKQIIIAAGEGAKAALSIARYLNSQYAATQSIPARIKA